VIKVNKTEDLAIPWHMWINAGKRSMLLDLKAAQGREIITRLLADTDVVSQNFALGVADRLGIGEADARAATPGVVYSSISAFGYEGKRGTWRGREELGQAVAGLQDRWHNEEGEPAMMSFPVSDVGSGHLAAFGILVSLYHRNRSGEGQSVSASLAHTASFIQAPFMLAYDGKVWDLPHGFDARGWNARNRLYKASDDRWFFAVVDSFDGIEGLDGVTDDGREARFATEPAQVWIERINRAGGAAHLSVTAEEAAGDPVARARGIVVEVEQGRLTVGPGPRPARAQGFTGTVPASTASGSSKSRDVRPVRHSWPRCGGRPHVTYETVTTRPHACGHHRADAAGARRPQRGAAARSLTCTCPLSRRSPTAWACLRRRSSSPSPRACSASRSASSSVARSAIRSVGGGRCSWASAGTPSSAWPARSRRPRQRSSCSGSRKVCSAGSQWSSPVRSSEIVKRARPPRACSRS
jgi:crotonobetainyl-CoA:carnitine CoA-transferase CaiB-like acyl-CoA transferase